MKLLDDILNACKIIPGDIVLLSSEVIHLFQQCRKENADFEFNDILKAFTDRIGRQGTLLIPTYNWGYCKGNEFSYLSTRGATGALGNAALKHKDFKRTKHPIYSFAVWGKDRDMLCEMNYTDSFGKQSVFDYLYRNNAINVLLDVDYNHSFTFLHYVEESVGCEYRYLKKFTSDYIDEFGKKEQKTYSMFVRKLELDVHMFLDDNRFEEYLVVHANAKTIVINGNIIRYIRLKQAYEAIELDIKNNKSRNLCSYIGQN